MSHEQSMRDAYANTAFARMGIPYERALDSRAIRAFLEAAARMNVGRKKAA